MYAETAKAELPLEWEEVEHLVKTAGRFIRFRYEYQVVWKRRALSLRTDLPEFCMEIVRWDKNRAGTKRVPVAECFDPEHACSVLRLLIAHEEDRETEHERVVRLTVNKIDNGFNK